MGVQIKLARDAAHDLLRVLQRELAAARKYPDKAGRALLERVSGADKTKWAALEELIDGGQLVNLGTDTRPKYRAKALREPLRTGEASAAVGSTETVAPLRDDTQQFPTEKNDVS